MVKGHQLIKPGHRFGLLVAVRRATREELPGATRSAGWLLKCDCGKLKYGRAKALAAGKLRSCGHLPKGRSAGYDTKSPEYKTWSRIKSRCFDPNHHRYKDYGGKGVTVCARWRDDFEAFLTDMGQRPGLEYSIDRWPDPFGNYEPGNCRWATDAQQRANQRRSVYVEVPDIGRVLLNDYVKELGLFYPTIYGRLQNGWTIEEAVTIPVKRHKTKGKTCGKTKLV